MQLAGKSAGCKGVFMKKLCRRMCGLSIGIILAFSVLTGCSGKLDSAEPPSVTSDTTAESGTEQAAGNESSPETEPVTEADSQPDTEAASENSTDSETVSGNDAAPDVDIMALEVGADETRMTLVWESEDTKGQGVRVWKVGEEEDYLDYGAVLERTEKDDTIIHYTAEIFDLDYGTQYGYKVGRDGKWSRDYNFTTKQPGPSFEFLAAGDPQIGTNDTYEDGMAWERALKLMTSQTGKTNFLLSLGDMADQGENKNQYDLFMQPEEMKSMAVATIVGNHDGEYYGAYFKMPNLDPAERGVIGKIGEESADYYFTYGDTLFLCLNSNDINYNAHKSFMKDTIDAYIQTHGSRPRWIIAAMHHSIYSITDHLDSANYYERQEAMAPMFSELGVDVVLMGHDHSHARTYPMNGRIPEVVKNEDGSRPTTLQQKDGQTIYFTLNSSTGSKFYAQEDIGEMIAFNNQEEVPNMTKVLVRPDRLIFTTCRVEEEASILEEFTLLHR